MKRFLSTTAVLIAMSGTAALAETHAAGFGSVAYQQGDFFASDLIGMRVYNSEIEFENDAIIADGAEGEWDDIGEINDLIVDKDGRVTAVILGIGGFLGMGERDVSVSMDALRVVREAGDSNDRFLVVTTSKEMLEQAPEFDRNLNGKSTMATDTAATTPAVTDPVVASDTAMERRMLTRPMVSRDGFEDAQMDMVHSLTAEQIQGSYVYGANDETVGEVDSLVLGDDGKIASVVINVGGFLGLGEKPVAVTFDELQILKNVNGDDFRIYIDSSKEALEAQPEYKG